MENKFIILLEVQLANADRKFPEDQKKIVNI